MNNVNQLLVKILPYVEKLALVFILIGAIFNVMDQGGMAYVGLGLMTLATVFFLNAYVPLEVPEDLKQQQQQGFSNLLGLVIIPKILGIASSVATVGLCFLILQMEGSGVMIQIGMTSIVVCIFLSLFIKIEGIQYLKVVAPRLIRSGIIAIMAFLLY